MEAQLHHSIRVWWLLGLALVETRTLLRQSLEITAIGTLATTLLKMLTMPSNLRISEFGVPGPCEVS